MITGDGVAKILDFGTAKVGDVQLTQPGVTVGTVAYMSPEHAEGHRVDARSDLWSVGAVLYEMASGRPPFGTGHTVAVFHSILNKESPSLAERADVPAQLAAVVDRCLEKDRSVGMGPLRSWSRISERSLVPRGWCSPRRTLHDPGRHGVPQPGSRAWRSPRPPCWLF